VSSAAAAFVLALGVAPAFALADPLAPSLQIHANGTWSAIPNLGSWHRGPGVAAGAEVFFNDIVGIGVDAGFARLLVIGKAPDDAAPSSLFSLSAGPVLRVDIARITPFVALQGAYTVDDGRLGDPERPSDSHFGLRASLGLEYAHDDHLRIAVVGDWGAVAPALLAYPAYATLRVRVAWSSR
jgi:hypothetical protein